MFEPSRALTLARPSAHSVFSPFKVQENPVAEPFAWNTNVGLAGAFLERRIVPTAGWPGIAIAWAAPSVSGPAQSTRPGGRRHLTGSRVAALGALLGTCLVGRCTDAHQRTL